MTQSATPQAGSPEPAARTDEFPPVRDTAGSTEISTGTIASPALVTLSVAFGAFRFGRTLTPAAARTLAAQLMLRADQAGGTQGVRHAV